MRVPARVALFGGSFDPPHRGHVAIARAAADQFDLDKVLFAPAGRQPLKSSLGATPFEQRMAMTALACAGDPRFAVSEIDAPRADGGDNYTVDTLARLVSLYPDATIFNLAGLDSFLDLARWREPERLLALAEWIVASRPGFAFRGGVPEPVGMRLTAAQRARVHVLNEVHEDVSATALRERLRAGEACANLLPPGVARYIAERRLYLAPAAGAWAAKPLP